MDENIFRNGHEQIDLSLNLDGLVPNHEFKQQLKDEPLLRQNSTITLPQLGQRGTYMLEFLGGGKRLRALIRKGDIKVLHRLSGEGELFASPMSMIKRHQAQVILNERVFTSDKNGLILIPFAQQQGNKWVVISDGKQLYVTNSSSQRAVSARHGLHIERESLIAGEEALAYPTSSPLTQRGDGHKQLR